MNSFTFIQRFRNKVKIKGNHKIILDDRNSLNMTGCTIYIKGKNNLLRIMKNTVIKNTNIEMVGDNCSIIIGENCMIGDNCYLSAKEENISILIENDCGLSRNIKVMTSDGHPIFQNNKRINKAKNIVISKKVWIADNVTILKGVNIGSGCVVGINSLVTKSMKDNCISAGNPAKIIKENITWQA